MKVEAVRIISAPTRFHEYWFKVIIKNSTLNFKIIFAILLQMEIQLALNQKNDKCQSILFPDIWQKQKALLESLLFASAEPVSVSSIAKAAEMKDYEVREIMAALILEYQERISGILIIEIADGYQMVTNQEYSGYIRKLKNINISNRLSQAALETLTIVAYKQPLTKLEIDHIRGVNTDGALKSLLEKKLIKIMGKKETLGRPFLYSTTNKFLEYFGLKNLAALPSIKDFNDNGLF